MGVGHGPGPGHGAEDADANRWPRALAVGHARAADASCVTSKLRQSPADFEGRPQSSFFLGTRNCRRRRLNALLLQRRATVASAAGQTGPGNPAGLLPWNTPASLRSGNEGEGGRVARGKFGGTPRAGEILASMPETIGRAAFCENERGLARLRVICGGVAVDFALARHQETVSSRSVRLLFAAPWPTLASNGVEFRFEVFSVGQRRRPPAA